MDEQTARAVLEAFAGMGSASAAAISPEGRLAGAEGFLADWLPRDDISPAFREPTWARLRGMQPHAGDGPVYRGPVTLADRREAAQAVTGALWRWDRGFLLVAERPPEDLEPMSKATVRLSNELAAAQRELADARRALTERDEQVRVMSFVDGVTGLGNQQAFARTLDAEIHRAGRYGGPLCLVLAAIDGLDGVSLHLGGDQAEVVLRCFARVVGGALRKSDHVCRVGDDRFMLMLTHTPLARAAAITDRIRTAFAAAAPGMVAASVAASFGNAAWREGDDAASLVARVEMALDAARAAGGGRAESA